MTAVDDFFAASSQKRRGQILSFASLVLGKGKRQDLTPFFADPLIWPECVNARPAPVLLRMLSGNVGQR